MDEVLVEPPEARPDALAQRTAGLRCALPSQSKPAVGVDVLVDGLWHSFEAPEPLTLEQRRHIGMNARLQVLQ